MGAAVIDKGRIGEVVSLVSDPLEREVSGQIFPSSTGGLHTINRLGLDSTRACILTFDQAAEAFYRGEETAEIRKACVAASVVAITTNSQPGVMSACETCDLRKALDGRCPAVMLGEIAQNSGEAKADLAFLDFLGVNRRSHRPGKTKSLGERVIYAVAARATDILGFKTVDSDSVDPLEKDELLRHGSSWLAKYKKFAKLSKSSRSKPDSQLALF